VIDIDDIRSRWQLAAPFLDERGRRLFAANESLALGLGGVTATARATGLARSTINRGIQELRSAGNAIGRRVRRPGGGRKSAVAHQPDLPAALEALIESAIRGDPCSPLRWVSRSQRHLVKALREQGFNVSQRVVANLLRELNYSCQANSKVREGGKHSDRDAQFNHINATVKAALGHPQGQGCRARPAANGTGLQQRYPVPWPSVGSPMPAGDLLRRAAASTSAEWPACPPDATRFRD
jgi:biotin operon repressor